MPGPASDVILGSRFIRAGAGAGKTTKLISTFLEFVRAFRQKEGRFPRVVMTTFTRKATQEVKERLLVSALNAGEKEVFEYINRKSFVHISTIHGLLSLFLSQYAERLRFPQEIRIVDAAQYLRTLRRQINDLLKRDPRYLDLLEQYSFAQLTELAAEALDFRAQHRDMVFVDESELRAAAEEKKAAIHSLIGRVLELVPQPPAAWQSYFGALAAARLALQEDREGAFLELLESFPAKPRWSNAKPPFDVEAHALIEELKDVHFKKLFSTRDYIARHQNLNRLFFDFTGRLFEAMLAHKRASGELTIADLETLSLQLLEEQPETAEEFSASWDYFMIDEYQDTSPLQVRILNRIIRDKPCFVVGDPQQSIYLFRGARSEVFEDKQREMRDRGAVLETLDTNYRSEPALMRFMNDFFGGFSPQFQPMQPKPAPAAEAKALPEVFFIKSPDQVGAVLQQIRSLLAQGAKPQEICVLSRSNGRLGEIAVRAARAQIPVQLQASAGFEERREILDLIAFSKFLNNPHDDRNFVMLARSPWFYIADAELLRLAQLRRPSLWAALAAEAGAVTLARERLLACLELFDRGGALPAAQAFVRETGFLAFSEVYDRTGRREANIMKFLTGLAQAEKTPGFSLGLFLEEQFQSLQSDLGSGAGEAQPVEQPDCVSLMTVHASKGLQFPHVVVTGFSDTPQVSRTPRLTTDEQSGRFSLAVLDEESSRHAASDWAQAVTEKIRERELLENERVLYVAMTRAIRTLSLVAETERRITSDKSWYKRIAWPEEGEVTAENYRGHSLTYDGAVSPGVMAVRAAVKARAPFAVPAIAGVAAGAVTDLLSASPDGEASAPPGFEVTLGYLKKAQKGSDLHRIFEAMKYRDHAELSRGLPAEDRAAVEYLLAQKELDLPALLEHGHNEWGFGLQTPARFLQGQIDLWAELNDTVHVLDYKTGSPRYAAKAFDQLAVYTLALLQMKMIPENKKITHSVIYPVEKTLKQRHFQDAADLRRQMEPALLALFGL